MAHDVGAGQATELDVVDVAEDVLDDGQTGGLAAGQVDLRGVARDDDLGAKTQAGEEHLHLADRRVLGLVQDDEGVVEGASAHVGQGRDFDRAGGHELGQGLGVEHVPQGVVEGTQVGVDLVGEGAGQEAEVLPRLDGRAGQDDAADFAGQEAAHGLGHRQVGLAGARGADAEDDGGAVNGVRVGLLAGSLGADRTTARGEDLFRGGLARGEAAEQADGLFDGGGVQSGAAPGHADEFFEEAGGDVDVRLGARQGDVAPGHEEADVREAPFEGAQNLVCDAEDRDRVHVCGDRDAPRGVCEGGRRERRRCVLRSHTVSILLCGPIFLSLITFVLACVYEQTDHSRGSCQRRTD